MSSTRTPRIASGSDPAAAHQRRRTILVVMCAGMFLVQLDVTIVNVALPHIGADLRTGLPGMQWVVDSYTVVLAACLLAAGVVGDRLGHRTVAVAGLALFGTASLLCGLAPGVGTLVAARALQGFAAALLLPSTLAVVNTTGRLRPDGGGRRGRRARHGHPGLVGAPGSRAPLPAVRPRQLPLRRRQRACRPCCGSPRSSSPSVRCRARRTGTPPDDRPPSSGAGGRRGSRQADPFAYGLLEVRAAGDVVVVAAQRALDHLQRRPGLFDAPPELGLPAAEDLTPLPGGRLADADGRA
ncbi:MFS transporter [Microbispora siamensis]